MKYRKLGTSDIEVSTISMGCWAIAGGRPWGDQQEEDAINAIRAALDLGMNTFDTAEGYGRGYSEELVGKALEGSREKAVIMTKVSSGHLAPEQVRSSCEKSLRRLRTDYIDLYQIHWPSRKVPLEETLRALEDLKSQGKIRAVGVSNFGVGDLSDALALTRVESDQLAYNLLFRAIEYGIVDRCAENDVGILCYSPLAQGFLTGKFKSIDDVPKNRRMTRHFSSSRPNTQHDEKGAEEELMEAFGKIRAVSDETKTPMTQLALSWLLYQGAVATVIAGARNVDQVTKNAVAAETELSDETVSKLTEITEPLKEKMGANPDMWLSDSRMR